MFLVDRRPVNSTVGRLQLLLQMNVTGKKFELAEQAETQAREREIQLLINLVEPDPQYQPFILTDEATLFDAVGADRDTIKRRLDSYFGPEFDFSLHMPLWKLVDAIKSRYRGWPDSFE